MVLRKPKPCEWPDANNRPTADPSKMPKLEDVQRHINEHLESAIPTIAAKGPKKLGFTFHNGEHDRKLDT
jgi:hypothetical protein